MTSSPTSANTLELSALSAPTPHITCPSWCIVTEAEHQADLDNWEGRCHHRSHETAFGWSISTTTTDGQPWPEPGEDAVQIFDRSDDVISLGCAQARAEAILKLIYRARRA